MKTIRIGLAQINSVVGDLKGNSEKIIAKVLEATKLEVDLIAFPELALTGYPPEDLLLKPRFIDRNIEYLNELAKQIKDITAIVGFVDSNGDIFNAAAIISDKEVLGVYHKIYLPNYGVFDEERYFCGGIEPCIIEIGKVNVGISICEDMWYPEGPVLTESLRGAEVIVNINASPFYVGKWRFREKMLAIRASDNRAIVAYVNMVGGQDELVFDGHSLIVNEKGETIARGKPYEEDLLVVDLDVEAVFRGRLHDPRRRKKAKKEEKSVKIHNIKVEISGKAKSKPPLVMQELSPPEKAEEVYEALVLGTRDYLKKNGFNKAVIGLSGGIDSALTSAIAVDALGSDNVLGVFMPSVITSKESREDTEKLVKNLKIELKEIPIKDQFDVYMKNFSEVFKGTEPNETEENLQARIRGNILMALSNKFGWLVLTTGNKSETGVGYTTLYGDTAGGFAVLKDVPKTMVYELARYRNSLEGSDTIPINIITKEPTAELRSEQKDSDTLPPYNILDPILEAYVEEDRCADEIISMGFEEEMVKRVIKMVDKAEYKRRQAPPGIKITPRAFGKDRRMPITNKYEG